MRLFHLAPHASLGLMGDRTDCCCPDVVEWEEGTLRGFCARSGFLRWRDDASPRSFSGSELSSGGPDAVTKRHQAPKHHYY